MTRSEKRALLEKSMTMQGFFEAACVDAEQEAAVWLEGNEEQSYSFGDLRRHALGCAEAVGLLRFGQAGGWVGLAVDTCPDWPVLLWG